MLAMAATSTAWSRIFRDANASRTNGQLASTFARGAWRMVAMTSAVKGMAGSRGKAVSMRDRRPIYHGRVIMVGMDIHRLRQAGTEATVARLGAELQSLRLGGLELLWTAGPLWPRHAPLLFPVVGGLRGDTLRHRGV